MSTAALSIKMNNRKDPNPSTVKDKYITVDSHNGILCYNMNESQEKLLMVRRESHWEKKCPQQDPFLQN